MFDPDFDPLKILQDVAQNQEVLFTNTKNLAGAYNAMLARLQQMEKAQREQQIMIDTLINQLTATNKANEILMQNLLTEMNKQIKDIKWPNPA